MIRIGVLKELAGRRVTVLAPSGVERLKGQAVNLVQQDAGRSIGFTNVAYKAAGTRPEDSAEVVFSGSDILLGNDHHPDGHSLSGESPRLLAFSKQVAVDPGYGMAAFHVRLAKGYSGVVNTLFDRQDCKVLSGDAKESLPAILTEQNPI